MDIKYKIPWSSVVDLFIIDQSFFALFVGWLLPLTSANISSLSIGLVDFLTGRLDRKSSSSWSNDKIEDFVVVVFVVVVVVVVVGLDTTGVLFSR
jgi:polyferredoxin